MFSAWADIEIDQQDIGSERIDLPAKRSPFSFDTHLDAIAPGKIDNGDFKGHKVQYAEAEAEAGMTVYYCPRHTEGLRVAAAFSPSYLKWHDNPWFDQDHFNLFKVSVSGFTKRMHRWFWRSEIGINFDTEDWSSKFTSYDVLFWGRYEYSENLGFHIGFLGQTGLEMDLYFPIIGFDWAISKKWKLQAVFPMNISLNYLVNSHWSIGIAGRLFSPRFRVPHKDHSLKPLVRYINAGAEFIIEYETESVSANIHAGSTLGGTLRLADTHGHHVRHFNLKPSAYAGTGINVKF